MTLNADNLEILGDQITLDRLFPPVDEGSQLLVAVSPVDYTASTVARAVEDTDAHLINLNVLADRSGADELMVHLRVDRRDGNAVARSLERYGYRVVDMQSTGEADDSADDSARDRVNQLLRLLEV